LIVASDTNPAPRLIERIATAFSARLFFPHQNLLRKEKHAIAKSYLETHGRVWNNIHERDALVASLYAWKKIEPVVRRIKAKLRKKGIMSGELNSFVERAVILQGKSIDSGIKGFVSKKVQRGTEKVYKSIAH